MNRPHRLNATSLDLVRSLIDRLDAVRRDADVACAIITGAGRAFCAGADLKETSGRDGFRGMEAKGGLPAGGAAGDHETGQAVDRRGQGLRGGGRVRVRDELRHQNRGPGRAVRVPGNGRGD